VSALELGEESYFQEHTAWRAFRFRSFMGVAPFPNQMLGCELYSVRDAASVDGLSQTEEPSITYFSRASRDAQWQSPSCHCLAPSRYYDNESLGVVSTVDFFSGHEAYTHSLFVLRPGPFAFAVSKVAALPSRPGSQLNISATGGKDRRSLFVRFWLKFTLLIAWAVLQILLRANRSHWGIINQSSFCFLLFLFCFSFRGLFLISMGVCERSLRWKQLTWEWKGSS
jgi:hypothetical protein